MSIMGIIGKEKYLIYFGDISELKEKFLQASSWTDLATPNRRVRLPWS